MLGAGLSCCVDETIIVSMPETAALLIRRSRTELTCGQLISLLLTDLIIHDLKFTSSMDALHGAVRRFLDSSSPTPRRYSEEDYELISDRDRSSSPNTNLPTPTSASSPHHRRRPPRLINVLSKCLCTCSLRRILTSFFLVPLLLALAILWNGVPPNYHDIRQYEKRLPQHNLTFPWPEGKQGKYLRFPQHLWGHGLNNILQET